MFDSVCQITHAKSLHSLVCVRLSPEVMCLFHCESNHLLLVPLFDRWVYKSLSITALLLAGYHVEVFRNKMS